MNRINILGSNTYNKIAAGEVVERPSSAVKELVENSIDAKSKNILVEIENGGQKYIKVLDDGIGIHEDDVQNAFMPHATSKISQIEDVFNIRTLGFRGEALPSIASISRIILKSKQPENEFGKEISIQAGEIEYLIDVSMNNGTLIEIRDLFYNVPARLKFLKTPLKEASNIHDIMCRMALSHEDISFTLINSGKTVLKTYGNGDLRDVIRAIYGKNTSENITFFEKKGENLSVFGYIGNDELARGTRNNQSIFVNRRYIKNKLVNTAVENAFKSFTTTNKFPFFILFIDILPEFVDVNIHPSKAEIKFKDEREIFKFVFDGVHSAFRKKLEDAFKSTSIEDGILKKVEDIKSTEIIPNVDSTKKDEVKFEEPQIKQEILNFEEKNENLKNSEHSKDVERSFNSFDEVMTLFDKIEIEKSKEAPKEMFKELSKSADENEVMAPQKELETLKPSFNPLEKVEYEEKITIESNKNVIMNDNSETVPSFPEYKIMGQFSDTYIICEDEKNDELIIIDQHALHEKYLFETYLNEILNKKIEAQVLMIPTVIELSKNDFSYYLDCKEIFSSIGLKIDLFGDNTIYIREIPFLLGNIDVKSLFLDILDNLMNLGNGEIIEVKYNMIAKLSCNHAIKAKNKLSKDEINSLLQKLRKMENPFTCPHGRPTIIKFTLREIEKKFKRIQ